MDLQIFDRMEKKDLRSYIEFLLWHYRVVDAFWFIELGERFGQETAEKMAGVKDVKQAIELQLELAKACSEKSMSNVNEVVEMLNAARDEYSSLIEENVKTAEKNVKQASRARKAA